MQLSAPYMFSAGLLMSAICFAVGTGDHRLAEAASRGDRAEVRSLLSQGADVNGAESDGSSPLDLAVQNRDLETAALLISAGADAKRTNRYGVSPLYLAASLGDAAMLEKLLTAGADPNAPAMEGELPLQTAAKVGSVESVKALVAHGANVNAKETWRGQTALMWAASENHPEVIKALVAAGADVHASSNPSQGAPAGLQTPQIFNPAGGFTALLFAIREGHSECAKVLLESGADVNETLANGLSALVLAVMNAHYGLAAYLLDKGADPNAAGAGWTALHQLVWTRNPNHHFNVPPAIPTDHLSSIDLAKALFAHHADVNARITKEPRDGFRNWMARVGSTPFVMAAKAADPELLRLLLANGADPKIAAQDGTTALMAAAGIGYWPGESPGTDADALEAVKICFQAGLAVNAVNAAGFTALHGAAVRGSNPVVQWLADNGAKLDATTKKEQWTALNISDGVFIANTYKATPQTAVLLRKLMGIQTGPSAVPTNAYGVVQQK